MPWASSRSRIWGTAAADSSLLTVTRTNSEPARASALTCATVPSMSAVSVLVMDCTTMGEGPPMETAPTFTIKECRRDLIWALYPERRFGAGRYNSGMNSLEPECLELKTAGVIDEATASRAVALERGSVFSVFEELRFVLYAAVAAM